LAAYTLTEPRPVEGGGQSLYCDLAFTVTLDAVLGYLIPLLGLKCTALLVNVPWGIAGSGREFTAGEAVLLEALWSAVLRRVGRS
jgi:hypothetical protein